MLLQTLITFAPVALPPLDQQAPFHGPASVVALQDEEANAAQSLNPITWAIPDDALFAILWNDPSSMIERRAESRWLQLLTDPELLALMWDMEASSESSEPSSLSSDESLALMLRILSGLEGAVFWLEDDAFFESGHPNGGAIAYGTEGSMMAIAEYMSTSMEPRVFNGRSYLASEETLFLHQGPACVWVPIVEDFESSESKLIEILDALHGPGDPGGPFHRKDIEAERGGSDMEFILQMDVLLGDFENDMGEDLPQVLVNEILAVEWVYIDASIGTDEESDWNLVIPLKEDGFLMQLLDAIQPLDKDSLGRIPKDCVSFSLADIAISSIVDVILEAAEEVTPDAHSNFEETLTGVQDQFGIDIEKALLANLTGPMLSFTLDMSVIDGGDFDSIGMANTFILDLDEPEAMQTALETLIESFGALVFDEGGLIEEETSWGTAWRTPFDEDRDMVLGFDEQSLLFTTEEAGLDAYLALKDEPNPANSILANEGATQLIEAFDGSLQAAFQTRAMTAFIFEVFNMALAEEPISEDEEEPMQDLIDFVDSLTDSMSEKLKGWMGYGMEVTSTRMRLLLKTR